MRFKSWVNYKVKKKEDTEYLSGYSEISVSDQYPGSFSGKIQEAAIREHEKESGK